MKRHVDGFFVLSAWRGPAKRTYANMGIEENNYYGYIWNLMNAGNAATKQVWVISANAVGTQRKGNYFFWGNSGVWAPSGIPMVHASTYEKLLIVHNLQIEDEVDKEHHDFSYIKDYYESKYTEQRN